MGSRVFTVYFRQFPESFDVTELQNIFSEFGEIIKIFIHHTRTYGMVEYADIGSCNRAIESLHMQPPHGMFVKMARPNGPSAKKERQSDAESITSSTGKRERDIDLNLSNGNQIFYDEEKVIYIDRNNKVLDVMEDDRGIIYVPLHSVAAIAGIRKVIRKSQSANSSDYINNTTNFLEIEFENEESRHQPPNYKRMIRDKRPDNTHNGFVSEEKMQSQPQNNRRRFNKEQEEDDWSENKSPQHRRPQNMNKPRFENKPQEKRKEQIQPRGRNISMKDDRSSEMNFPTKKFSPNKQHDGAQAIKIMENKQSYSTVQLPTTLFTNVVVTVPIDNKNYWVQLDELRIPMVEMITRVMEEGENSIQTTPTVGQLYLAKFDGNWYRAAVLSVKPLRVRYIDFGNEQTNPEGGVHAITAALSEPNAQAIHIRLPHPMNLQEDDKLKVKLVEVLDDVHVVQIEEAVNATAVSSAASVDDVSKYIHIMHRLERNQTGILVVGMKLEDNKITAGLLSSDFSIEMDEIQELNCTAKKGFIATPGDIVGAQINEEWSRALVLECLPMKKHRVAFIDYGREDIVDELRPLSEDKRSIGWFTCVCTLPKQNIDSILEEEALDYEVLSDSRNGGTVSLQLLDSTTKKKICRTELTPWWPNIVKNGSEEPIPELSLKNGARVQLVSERDGLLYARTKKSLYVLQSISDHIKSWQTNAPSLEEAPKVGDMVGAFFLDGWYRAYVEKVDKKHVALLYVDYGNCDEKEWSELKQLDNKLIKFPGTLFPIKLESINKNGFSPKQLERLAQIAENKTLYTVEFDGESAVEGAILKTKDGAELHKELERLKLDEQPKTPFMRALNKCTAKSRLARQWKVPRENDPRIMMDTIGNSTITLGNCRIRILELINPYEGILSFCVANEQNDKKIYEELKDLIHGYVQHIDSMPSPNAYCPQQNEIILALERHSDEWRRAVFTEHTEDGQLSIFFIDHGHILTVLPGDIRRISPDLTSLPANASFGTIKDLPEVDEAVSQRLTGVLSSGSVHQVKLEHGDDMEFYFISLPEVFDTLRSEGLL